MEAELRRAREAVVNTSAVAEKTEARLQKELRATELGAQHRDSLHAQLRAEKGRSEQAPSPVRRSPSAVMLDMVRPSTLREVSVVDAGGLLAVDAVPPPVVVDGVRSPSGPGRGGSRSPTPPDAPPPCALL
eukprot:gene19171-48592_t